MDQDQRRPKNLTPQEFNAFLSKLDADFDRSGEIYVQLYEKLTTYFQTRSCFDSTELADETINRVARKILNGESPNNIRAYCFGFAKNILMEQFKKARTEQVTDETNPSAPAHVDDEIYTGEQLACLKQCLKGVSESEAKMLIRYMTQEDRPQYESRKDLAEEFKLTQQALRLRIHRIKPRIENCLKKCLSEAKRMK